MKISFALAPGLLAAWGCAGSQEDADFSPGVPLTLPMVKHLVKSSGILHEVTIFLEMDRPLRPQEEPLLMLLTEEHGEGEQYAVGYEDQPFERHHRFAYDKGKFVAGGFRYPAQRNAVLYILRERAGPFKLTFRGRRVSLDREGAWKPAILYRAVEEKTELSAQPPVSGRRTRRQRRQTVTRLLREEVQVGPHHLILFPGLELMLINGHKVLAPEGSTIGIDTQGRVRVSR